MFLPQALFEAMSELNIMLEILFAILGGLWRGGKGHARHPKSGALWLLPPSPSRRNAP